MYSGVALTLLPVKHVICLLFPGFSCDEHRISRFEYLTIICLSVLIKERNGETV